MRNEHQTIGEYDGRLAGPSSLNTGETSEYDPSSTLITPPFTAVFTDYIRTELNYKTDMFYYRAAACGRGIIRCRTASATPPACCTTRW